MVSERSRGRVRGRGRVRVRVWVRVRVRVRVRPRDKERVRPGECENERVWKRKSVKLRECENERVWDQEGGRECNNKRWKQVKVYYLVCSGVSPTVLRVIFYDREGGRGGGRERATSLLFVDIWWFGSCVIMNYGHTRLKAPHPVRSA